MNRFLIRVRAGTASRQYLSVSQNSPDFERHDVTDLGEVSPAENLNQAMDDERTKMSNAITNPSKIATLTLVDTYSTEDVGVLFAQVYRE